MLSGSRIFYLLVMITGLVACGSPSEKPLRVGSIPWAGYEFLYLARDQKYYDDAKIQLKELSSTTDVIHAFRQGQLDAVAITLDEALRLTAYQSDFKIILVFNISHGADKLIVAPHIDSLADLKGKRIAVEQSGVGRFMLSQLLQLSGLNLNDIVTVPATINQHFFLLDNHQVDAVISFDPMAYQLQQQGYRNLLDSRQLPIAILDVLVVREKVLDHHPETVQHLLQGYWKARGLMVDNPKVAMDSIAQRLGVSKEALVLLYQDLILPDKQQQQEMLDYQLANIIESMNKLMLETGLLKHAITPRQLIADIKMD